MPPKRRKSRLPTHKQYLSRAAVKPANRSLNYFIGVLSLIVLVFVSSTVMKIMTGESSSLPPETTYLRVQVLNGCGIPKAASRTAKAIRSVELTETEFDVIEVENFESYDVSETLIIAREERSEHYALLLAERFGISRENVVVKPLEDNFLGIDLTVVVGRDITGLLGGDSD
jgi:hypothetical protein